MNRYIALQKVIEVGSFTKAAEVLGYTQSSVSQMIASLEKEIGMKLLVRTRHEISLTPEGNTLFPYIEQAIYQYRSIYEKVNEIKKLDTGVIRIGTFSSISYQWLPDLVKGFQEKYPNVEFVFYQGDYSSIEKWIHTGKVDFGFITPSAVKNIETEILEKGEMLVVLPKCHPLHKKEKIQIKEISEIPFILLEEGHYNETMIAFEKENKKPNIKFIVHDDFTIMRMVEKEMGISILSELMTKESMYNIETKSLDPPIYRTVAVGYKNKSMLPIAARRFIDYISSQIKTNIENDI